jgi:hypothetical protein
MGILALVKGEAQWSFIPYRLWVKNTIAWWRF